MSDFFLPDDSNGSVSSSDHQAEACYTTHGQITVNRLFSTPRMSRMINPTAETMNTENPTVRNPSEGNASNPAAGGSSVPSESDVSHIQLNFIPLTAESQVKTEKEVEEGMDGSTSSEHGLSEERNGGSEPATGTEPRIHSQASESKAIAVASKEEVADLPEAPGKEEKEEEKPPAPHLAAEKEPVVPQLPKEEEPVSPPSIPDKQIATPSPPGKKASVPQLLPENEEKVAQSSPETEPSFPCLPLETDPSVSQPLPQKEQKAPQSPQEMEPSESKQNVPQLPVETEPSVLKREPSVPHPQVFKEPSLPQTPAKTEPPVPHPQVFKEPSLPQTPAETEQPVPHQRVFKEPSLPQTPAETQRPVPHQPVFKEPSLPQTPAETQRPVPHQRVFKDPSLPQTPAEMEPPVPCPQIFKGRPVPQTPPEMKPPISQPPNIIPQTPAMAEQPIPRLRKETPAPALPSLWDPITPQPPAIKEFLTLQSIPDKASPSAYPKPKPATAPHGGKGSSLHDAAEDLASHLKDVGNASKSAMASSISSFVASPVGQVFANTIDRALEKSEEWLDYYLPVLETDVEPSTAAEEEQGTASEDLCKEGCFMRISSLSTKLRNRAFRLALHQLKTTRQSTRETLPVLDQMLDLLDRTRGQSILSVASIPESLHNLWAQKGSKQEPLKSPKISRTCTKETPFIVPEQLELKALDLTRTLALQLYSTYHDLLPHVADLPAHIQEKAIRVHESMEELQSHFKSSPSLRELPSSLALQSRQKMAMARENLDEILDFLAQNRATNWLSQPASSPKGKQSTSAAAERQPKGRNSERKAKEESSTSRQPPSPPHL
ncbi:uncharacterized protein LOC143835052 isoform X2 [Paroedura picta]|uniref:uncharacterized protein LOC143835052 isoform X2 n=1 Tax=Paroedura picta TaxID=143630 RepID=UPI004056FDE5